MKATWDLRAKYGVKYKGQNYYTITALPFYLRRQKILLSLLEPYKTAGAYVILVAVMDNI
jgi:hypothetical protein